MKRRIILWDNDIGWCEKLRRELAKLKVELEEPDVWEEIEERDMNLEKRLLQFVSEKKDVIAVVLSATLISDGIEGEQKERCEAWNRILEKLCRECVVPIVLITDKASEEQELAAFEAGVCDYIKREKTISISVRRILACSHKRRGEDKLGIERMGCCYFDEKKRCIHLNGKEINLTQKEYQVFFVLWENKGELVLKQELFETVWGEETLKSQRVVDTIVKQLRNKLKETPYVIQTKYRQGYYIP